VKKNIFKKLENARRKLPKKQGENLDSSIQTDFCVGSNKKLKEMLLNAKITFCGWVLYE